MQSISMGLALFAFRHEVGRDPVDGNEVLEWVSQVGFGFILGEYGVPWESERHKPRPIRPLRFSVPRRH